MTLLALVFALLFIVLIVVGIALHLYLYSHGAFTRGRSRRMRMPRLSAASFSQTATIPVSESAAELYYGRSGPGYGFSASAYPRKLLLYSAGIVVSLIVLGILVLSATQF